MNKYYLKVASFVALFAMCVALMPASAAGRVLTRGATDSDGQIDTAGADGYATTTVFWTTGADYAAGTQVRLTVTWSATDVTGSSTNLGACATTTNFGTGASYSGLTPSAAIVTLAGTVTAGTVGGVCVRVPVSDAGVLYEGNFSLAVITSNVSADYGAVEYYVNGGNDVLVDASVQPTLEFAVVSSTNVALEQHECHMGTLNLTSVGTCDYRLRVSTNAKDGFQVTIESDQQLGTGTATITDTGAATVTAGTEGYGIALTGATAGGNDGAGNYTSAITEDGTY